MDTSDKRIMMVLYGVPFASLIYCALVVGSMLSFPTLREHPLLSGGIAALIPLVVGASIWIGASAQAYAKARNNLKDT